VTRRSLRQQIATKAAAASGGGYVVDAARVWATDTSRRVPLVFRQRLFYDLAVTDQHVVLLTRPRRIRLFRRRARTEPTVTIPYSSLTVDHVRRNAILLQVRLGTEHGHEQLVLEFRPTDRSVARSLIGQIQQAPNAGSYA
jgi:hypothetical protein